MPVYLVVNDGGWRVTRFADLLFRVHLIDYESEVLGPFEIPEDRRRDPGVHPTLRETIVERLAERRGRQDARDDSGLARPA